MEATLVLTYPERDTARCGFSLLMGEKIIHNYLSFGRLFVSDYTY